MEYLKKNVKDNALVECAAEYRNYVLMFYEGHRLRFGPCLGPNTHLGAERMAQFPAPLMIQQNFPDWIFGYGYTRELMDTLNFFTRVLQESSGPVRYEYKLKEELEICYDNGTRPELGLHQFIPRIGDKKPKGSTIYVFQRPLEVAPVTSPARQQSKPAR